MKKLNPIDEYNEVMNMNLKQKRVFNQWSEIQKLKEEIDREEFRQMLVNGEILPTATESQDQMPGVQ